MPGQLLRIGRNVLIACGSCRDRYKTGHPRGTAQLTTTGSNASNASGLLTGSDLFHFDTHPESLGQHLDELTEIHTTFGYIIEDGLITVTLILHVTDFHVQPQAECYLPGTYHGRMLARLGLSILLHISRFSLTVDTADIGFVAHSGFLHLQGYKAAGQSHDTDIVTGCSLNRHNISFRQFQAVGVAEIAFPRILELHFDILRLAFIAGNVCQPVIRIQLPVLPSATAEAKPPASVM